MIPWRNTFERHYQIGVVPVTLRTSVRSIVKTYDSLYGYARTNTRPNPTIEIEVERKPFTLRHRPRFNVSVNGQLHFEPAHKGELLPCVEWCVNWELPRLIPNLLQLHAASMQVGDQGIILAAHSGSGKSTLSTALLSRGWKYLSDEFALIDVKSRELHPYPRAICIKRPGYEVIESLGVPYHGKGHYLKGAKGYVRYVRPLDIRSDALGTSCPIRHVIFPHYVKNAQPQLVPMHRAEAVFELHKVCFNLLGCSSIPLDVLSGMIRNVTCHRLNTGEIQQSCDLVDALVHGRLMAHAQSA